MENKLNKNYNIEINTMKTVQYTIIF